MVKDSSTLPVVQSSLFINGEFAERVNEYKHLGIVRDNKVYSNKKMPM